MYCTNPDIKWNKQSCQKMRHPRACSIIVTGGPTRPVSVSIGTIQGAFIPATIIGIVQV